MSNVENHIAAFAIIYDYVLLKQCWCTADIQTEHDKITSTVRVSTLRVSKPINYPPNVSFLNNYCGYYIKELLMVFDVWIT